MPANIVLGAIIGDIVGSTREWKNIRSTDFDLFPPRSRFTDDTVLTIAVADAILYERDFALAIWEYGNTYPEVGYGKRFKEWLKSTERQPYQSFGNGSAMRVSPVAAWYKDLATVLRVAQTSAAVTHDHPEGIKGAQALASAIFLAKTGASKADIKTYVTDNFAYDLQRSIEAIRPVYRFDVSCQGSVPEAIIAFLESTDYEQALRLAISIGGDSDTIACMTGGLAAAFYGDIPASISEQAHNYLLANFWALLSAFDPSQEE